MISFLEDRKRGVSVYLIRFEPFLIQIWTGFIVTEKVLYNSMYMNIYYYKRNKIKNIYLLPVITEKCRFSDRLETHMWRQGNRFNMTNITSKKTFI